MKITSLTLQNFRSARTLSVPVDDRCVLVAGLNGAGKTTVREAMRWCLRGVCDTTDLKGAGAEALVAAGAKDTSVALTIDGIGEVRRSFAEHGGSAFSVEGFTGTSAVQQQALLNRLGTSAPFLDAVCETDAFFRLHHADSKALVLQLLNVKVELPVDGGMARFVTLDELDVQYKQAFEERKDLKRRLQTLAVSVAPVLPEAVRTAQERTGGADVVSAVRGRIDAIRAQLGLAERAVGEVAGQRAALRAEQERLKAIIGQGLPVVDEEAIGRWQDDLAALTPSAPLAVNGAIPLHVLKDTAAAIDRHLPVNGCVLDRTVPCKTPRKAFNERASELLAQIEAIPTESLSAAGRTEAQRLEARIREGKQWIEVRERTRAAIATANLRLPDLLLELKALPDTSVQEQDVQALKDRIRKGEDLLAAAHNYFTALATHQQQTEARDTLERQLVSLEDRVEMLGPKGLRVVALAEAMSTFEAAINRSTDRWGWQVQIQAEPWTVLANGRPVETYSRSERYRLGIAIQLAVAELSGLRFAIVDEMDMLDADNRRTLMHMVNASELEQGIVLTTLNASQALPEAREGWIFVRLGKDDEGISRVAETVRPVLQEA